MTSPTPLDPSPALLPAREADRQAVGVRILFSSIHTTKSTCSSTNCHGFQSISDNWPFRLLSDEWLQLARPLVLAERGAGPPSCLCEQCKLHPVVEGDAADRFVMLPKVLIEQGKRFGKLPIILLV